MKFVLICIRSKSNNHKTGYSDAFENNEIKLWKMSINVYIMWANGEIAHIEQLLILSNCLQRSFAYEGKDNIVRFNLFIV